MEGTRKLPANWLRKQKFWNAFFDIKFKGAKPADIPVPVEQDRKIKPIPLGDYYPSVPVREVLVADHIPKDEVQRLIRVFISLHNLLARWYSLKQPGLPPIPDDPEEALMLAYPPKRRRIFPAPVLPSALEIEDPGMLLGRLAVEGPFSDYLEQGAEGPEWNTLHLNDADLAMHPGLEPVGARVLFEADADRSLKAVRIECAKGASVPTDPGWEVAVKTALCGASTDLSVVRHYSWVHMGVSGVLSFAVRNCLNPSHPLCRLLWPHMHRTQYSNDIITETQCDSHGDFVHMFSYAPEGLWALIDKTHRDYRIEMSSPRRDAERRGLREMGIDLPTQDNLEDLFDVFHRHTRRYIETYFPDDAALAADAEVVGFLEKMEELIPNGITAITGGKTTIDGLSELCAAMIQMAAVQHEAMGTHLWNYQLWADAIPSRIYTNGQRTPIDVYQRVVNNNFILNIDRAQLMQDFSYLALDDAGKRAFKKFFVELQELNTRMRSLPNAPWKVYPDILEANVNA